MQITILHLSDLHFKSDTDHVMDRTDKICDAIISRVSISNAFFLVTTGDIAWSGSEKQYDIAMTFYDIIIKRIRDNYKIEPVFISIPGNHDCDFSDSIAKDINERLINGLTSEDEISDGLIQTLMGIQNHYYDFANVYNPSISKRVFSRLTYPIDQKLIEFNLINTAWMSSINEKEGTLIIPTNDLLFSNSHDLSISIWHHPTRWFNCENDKRFRAIVESHSDLIMIGHEHIPEHMQITKKNSNIKYFYGGAFQENSGELCSFNLLDITLENKFCYHYHFSWSKDFAHFDVEEEKFPLNVNSGSQYILIDRDFHDELLDLGMSVMHPRCENVKLNHLYIYPDLDVFTLDDDNRIVRSNEVESYLIKKGSVLLYGEDLSGKTAITKKLFISFYESNIFPVLLSGEDIATSHIRPQSVVKLIEKLAKDQYGELSVEKYLQLSANDKAIIIDDFHLCKLNQQGKEKFLSNLELISKHLILLVSGSYHSQFIEERNIYSRFTVCQIREFGHKLRFDLMKKWISLGQEYTIEESSLMSQCYTIEALINSVIGKKFMPTYPSYLILLLQQSSQAKLKENTSTHGHLYDFLIKGTLLKNGFESKEIDSVYTFLGLLAYYMFSHKYKFICEQDLSNQLSAYNVDYDMLLGRDFIARLISAKIIKMSHGDFNFSYLYYYYFFVAYYIDANFDKETTRATLEELLEKLYLDDYGNIVIFLCHFNKSKRLFYAIADKAKSIFSQRGQYNIDSHNEFIREIQSKVQFQIPIMLPSLDIQMNKEAALKKQDDLDKALESNGSEFDIDYESDDPYMDGIKSANSGFRIIEVIGHIIKNYAGSIDKDNKMMLLSECFKLGMRSLNFHMEILQDMIEPLIEYTTGARNKKNTKLTAKEISDRTTKLIFDLCFFFAYGQIRIISRAIASEDLMITYERILTENPDSALTLVLESAVLNDLRRLGTDKLLSLADKYDRTNPFCFNILRRMAYDYLYYNKCEPSVRQRISTKLDFKSSNIDLLASPENKMPIGV